MNYRNTQKLHARGPMGLKELPQQNILFMVKDRSGNDYAF